LIGRAVIRILINVMITIKHARATVNACRGMDPLRLYFTKCDGD
jgi:hypothetical protein